jgi:hypothetical protein
MVYVDLNLIRAGLAVTPEESDYTSIQERIRAWQEANMPIASAPTQTSHDVPSGSFVTGTPMAENTAAISNSVPERQAATVNSFDEVSISSSWLCPIQSDSRRCGILPMTAAEYFDLVDKSGRMTRADKRGAIDTDLAPILLRIGANPDAWIDTVTRFGSKFRLAAGMLVNLRKFADQLRRRWLVGVAAARDAFASSPLQTA